MDAPDFLTAAAAVALLGGVIAGLVGLVCGAIRRGRGRRLRPEK